MKKLSFLSACALAITLGSACEKSTPQQPQESPETPQATQEAPAAKKTPLELARENAKPFAQLPKDWAKEGQTSAQEDLGRMLYYDTRLSKNHDISCNSCHGLDSFGVDAEATSPGHKGARGDRNSPTVYNAAGHVQQFWDGRAADVEAQAKGPVLNPVEMAMPSEERVVEVLSTIPGYVEAFSKAYPKADPALTYDNMANAIGAFERRLTTPSRWDKFLEGDDKALSGEELDGFNLFVSTGCHACHSGALVGGAAFYKLGAVEPWPEQDDKGVFAVSKKDDDLMMFKAPSLRNIAKTGPYFHDGSAKSLDEAIAKMGKHQLGADLTAAQVKSIATWLESLTGEPDKAYIAKPTLPASGPKTPKPDPT